MKTLDLSLLASTLAASVFALPGDVDTSFNPNVGNGSVWASVVQPDGRIIIVGDFTLVGGQTRNRVARLNADGTLDATFNPDVNGLVACAALQPDGKVLIGGSFTFVGGTIRSNLARLSSTGSLELSFNSGVGPDAEVDSVVVQPDGKVLIGGFFSSVNGLARGRIARLNADGSLESTATFNPGTGAANSVQSIALQPDGKILVGGQFVSFNGATRTNLARLNANGTLEGTGTFNTTLNGAVYAIAVEADGRFWIGGDFISVNGATINRMVRLNANGSTAAPALTGSPATVRCFTMQTNGKVLLSGDFTALNGQARGYMARLGADGSLESAGTFSTGGGANNIVRGLTLQPDGKIIACGAFTSFNGGTTRPRILRLINDSATQSLAVPSPSLAQWTCTGAGPEVLSTSFELSTDGGANWSPLGSGTRTASGWDMSGLTLSGSGQIRARGRTIGGNQTGSSSFTESVQSFNFVPEIVIEQPAGTNLVDGTASIDFGTVGNGMTGTPKTFTITNTGNVDLTLNGITGGNAFLEFLISDPSSFTIAPGGSATFTVSFKPTASGPRSGALQVLSNDSDEGSFDIALTGTGISMNANISLLVPGTGTLVPAFSPSTTSYTMDVPNSTTSLSLQQFSEDGATTVTLNGDPFPAGSSSVPIALTVGNNVITIVATAEDMMTTKTYTLTVHRQGTGNANLLWLAMSPGNIAPGFGQDVTSYAVLVSNTTTTVTFTPQVVIGSSTVTVNGVTAANNTPSAPVNLSVGSNAIPIIVTAGDHVTTKTYTVNVTRLEAQGTPVPGNVDPLFNPGATGIYVQSSTEQPDGKTILCGRFTTVAGQARNNIARLMPDGSLESTASFNPGTGPGGGSPFNSTITATIQDDLKILVTGVFTTWDGQPRKYITRLNRDGTLDPSFTTGTGANDVISGALMQPDGKIIVFGYFTSVSGTPRNRVARLNSDGTLDTSFNPGSGASDQVLCAALQNDGKILIGGNFGFINGVARGRIARLNANGTLDTSFNPGTGFSTAQYYGPRPSCIIVQPNDQILVGGEFGSFNGTIMHELARLNPDGTLEGTFTFDIGSGVASGEVRSVSLQSDGKIVIGGLFGSVNDQPRNGFARLHPNGAVESSSTFSVGSGATGAPYTVLSAPLHSDGSIWLTGSLTEVNGLPRSQIARVLNDPAIQTLSITSSSRVEWLRGGSAPEIQQARFEFSTDGETWTPLGFGTPILGGYELTGLSLPANGFAVRARGRTCTSLNCPNTFVESKVSVPVPVTEFRQTFFGTTSNSGNAADDADPDHDGVPNIVEYAFGSSPTAATPAAVPEPAPSGGNFGVSFEQPPSVTGITYGAEYSIDMIHWFPVTDSGSGGEHVFSVPIGSNTKVFMRLVVTPQ